MKFIQIFALSILLLSSCSKDDKPTELDCSLVLCTAEFRSITVDLVNNDGVIITPGYPYFIERTLVGSTIDIEIVNEVAGKFVILDDSHRSILKSEGTEIIVKVYRSGFAGNDLLNTSKYVIGYDCCHVNKISGPDSIKIE